MTVLHESRPTAAARLRYGLARLVSNPLPALAAGAVLIFTCLILGPVLSVLSAAFVAGAADPGVTAPPGAFTWYYWQRMLTSTAAGRLFWEPLLHTFQLTIAATALTILLGVMAGWLVSRTDVPFARHWLGLMLLAYMIPSWAFAQSWLTVFKNGSAAGAPGFLQAAGVVTPDWLAYGLVPSALVLALHRFPLVMVLSADAFGRIDAAQEEAARLVGAGRRTILFDVMLPAIRPALLSAALLTVANAIGDFGVPYVLGLPVDWDVLATSLYGELRNDRRGTASVLAVAITVIGMVLIYSDTLLARGARRFETVSGSTARTELTHLRAGRWPALGFLALLGLFAFGLPLFVLATSTIMRRTIGGRLTLDNLTLDFWWFGTGDRDFPDGLLQSGEFWHAAWNTLWVAALAAGICAVVGLVVGILIKNAPGVIGGALRQITFLPHLLPGIALAGGLIALFNQPRGPIPALYGTFALLVIGMVIDELPFTTRVGISAVSQLGGQLDEAARISGARWYAALWRVDTPLLTGALGSAVIFPFVSCMKDLTLVVMLFIGSTPAFLPQLALDLGENGLDQEANAVTLVITILAVTGGVLARRFGKGSASAAIAA